MSDKYSLLNRAYHYIDRHDFNTAEKIIEQAKQMHVQEITNLHSEAMPCERKFNELQFNAAFKSAQEFLWCEMVEIY